MIAVRVTATDGLNASVTTDFTITVANVNDAPVVEQGIADQQVVVNRTFDLTLPDGLFSDADLGDAAQLTLTATLDGGVPLPGWLAFDPVSGLFSGVPQAGSEGIVTIAVTATDPGGASATTTFNLTVFVEPIIDVTVVDGIDGSGEDGSMGEEPIDLILLETSAGNIQIAVSQVSGEAKDAVFRSLGDANTPIAQSFRQSIAGGSLTPTSEAFSDAVNTQAFRDLVADLVERGGTVVVFDGTGWVPFDPVAIIEQAAGNTPPDGQPNDAPTEPTEDVAGDETAGLSSLSPAPGDSALLAALLAVDRLSGIEQPGAADHGQTAGDWRATMPKQEAFAEQLGRASGAFHHEADQLARAMQARTLSADTGGVSAHGSSSG